MKQLDVFMGTDQIGYLRERDDGVLIFGYNSAWFATGKAVALSPELPLSEQEHVGQAVTAYFDNLLPEGSVRDFIARVEHISPNNVFGLLERFGGDTASAFSLLPQGQTPSAEPHYLPVPMEAIREWFATSRGIPLNITGEQARMSLSGAQDKLTVFVGEDGAMAIPLGSAPSSHIIKPSMGYPSQIPQTAINEALVMTLAKAIKLDVPDVQFMPELDAVVISRYDREITPGGRLKRLHQNDLCQIMGVPSQRKYESEGGPSLKTCIDAIMQHSSQPALDKKRMIEWVAFNLAIGNMDSHAKNISLLVVNERTRLAPFYDMVCTTVYPNLSKKFAFKIGGENRPGWIMNRHWERFAGDIDVKPQLITKIRLDMSERIESALPEVCDSLRQVVNRAEGLAMIERVEAEVRRSVGQLRAHATASAVPAPLHTAPVPTSPDNALLGFDHYLKTKISAAQRAFEDAQETFWACGDSLPALRSEIEQHARATGTDPHALLASVFSDAPPDDFKKRIADAVAASNEVQTLHDSVRHAKHNLEKQLCRASGPSSPTAENDTGYEP